MRSRAWVWVRRLLRRVLASTNRVSRGVRVDRAGRLRRAEAKLLDSSRRGGGSRRHQSLCGMLSGLLCAGLGHRAGAWFVNERAKRDARGNAGTRKNERANQ